MKMIFIYIFLLLFKSRAKEHPPIYGVMSYGHNSYQPTKITTDTEESSEEDSDSDEYVTCTCETCSDISCEEYCKTCPQSNPREYMEQTYDNIQYVHENGNLLENNYGRIALRTVENVEPTYKVYNVPKDHVYNVYKEIYKPKVDAEIINNKPNEKPTESDNSIVKLTYNKGQNDIINIEFLLNNRYKVLNEENYVNTPIRRTKLKMNEDLADTHYRHMKTIHSK